MDDDDQLGRGGQKLYEELALESDPYELTALIVEAARIKDRLDRLHLVLTGDEELWMRLVPSRGDAEVLEVRVDGAAQESRQLATVFRQMLAEVQRRRSDGGNADEYDPLDDL
ncbi:hypothetical protein GS935_05985 [Rhodococcus hoagii]|nr:hypothetical protein [Prescottella equi]